MTKSVLIVEDEIFLAIDLERILEAEGYEVAGIAADSEEAMAAAPKARIAFVDVNLRDGPTGPRIARALAEQFGMKIVYVTANPSQIAPPARDAIGVVQKPFREETILLAAALASGESADSLPRADARELVLFDWSTQPA
ncbi:MAG: response regulator [Caulobacterales bacterium]